MKRRAFLRDAVVSAAWLSVPTLSHAQRQRRIGVLQFPGGRMTRGQSGWMAFIGAMKELGYVENRDYVIEERIWQKPELAAPLARELVALKPDVIIAPGPPSLVAVRAATQRIPIVMMYSAEPVALGIVQSLSRPGGNITGLTWDHGFETVVKALEVLKAGLPKLRRVGLIWDGTDSAHPTYAAHFERGAKQGNVALTSLELRSPADIEPAFAKLRESRAGALAVLPSGQITIPHAKRIMSLAASGRHPTLVNYVGREEEFAGAVFFYGPNLASMPRRAASYVDRIFKGAKPADIPVEQPDKYDLVVDLSAAHKLGIKVQQSVLVRADRVIQ